MQFRKCVPFAAVAVVLSFICALQVIAAEPMESESEGFQLQNTPHIYGVVPGSDIWQSLSLNERVEACDISENEVNAMTTEALLSTVLEYPFIVNIYAYNSLGEGIEAVSEYFPGIIELLERENAEEVLQEYLASVKPLGSTDSPCFTTMCALDLLSIVQSSRTEEVVAYTQRTASKLIVNTPAGSPVVAIVDLAWSDHELTNLSYEISLKGQYLLTYPGIEVIDDVNPTYNCFSYAFYYASSANHYWINAGATYLNDGSYVDDPLPNTGSRIIYVVSDEATGGYNLVHAGIAVGPVINYMQARVVSKWGTNALFEHNANECPYAIGTEVAYVQRNPSL